MLKTKILMTVGQDVRVICICRMPYYFLGIDYAYQDVERGELTMHSKMLRESDLHDLFHVN